ncbi:hypothetical protein pb186bvf_010554 [Paramecium bursaria]
MANTESQAVANLIYQTYNDNYSISTDNNSIHNILSDIYKDLDKQHNEITEEDIETLHQIMDVDGDGVISMQDLESLCQKYLEDYEQFQDNFQFQSPPAGPQVKEFLSVDNSQILNQSQAKPRYNQRTKKRLEICQRLFHKYQKFGYVTEKELQGLLFETYQQMGMEFHLTQNDIYSWMKMADKDNDGRMSITDFQDTILDGFIQGGINIYE